MANALGLNCQNKKPSPLHSPVEGEHNQSVTGDAQHPDDEHEEGDDVVSMGRHVHFGEERALGLYIVRLHAVTGPHDSNSSLKPLSFCSQPPSAWLHHQRLITVGKSGILFRYCSGLNNVWFIRVHQCCPSHYQWAALKEKKMSWCQQKERKGTKKEYCSQKFVWL